MKGRPSIRTRTARLEATARRTVDMRGFAAWAAADLGIPVEELIAETAEWAARGRAAGAVTDRAFVTWAAKDAGFDPEELWAEARRSLAAYAA